MTDESTITESDEESNTDETTEEQQSETYERMDAPQIGLPEVAGIEKHRETLRTTVVNPLVSSNRLPGAKSVLFTGGVGSGKSYTARALLGTLAGDGVTLGEVADLQAVASDPDELATVIDAAIEEQPAALYLGDLEGSWLTQMYQAFRDQVGRLREQNHRVIIIGTANWENPGPQESKLLEAFQVRIDLERPSPPRRQELLQEFLCDTADQYDTPVDVTNIDFERAATTLPDRTVSDLRNVCDRAIQIANADGDTGAVVTDGAYQAAADAIAMETEDAFWIDQSHADSDVCEVETSPDVSFDEIGGLNDVKRQVRELLTASTNHADLYSEFGLEPEQGILLYGPPGNGKTMLARAIASEFDRTFFAVNGPELKSPYSGRTESEIRRVFEAARERAPSVVFFDELDSLGVDRDSIGLNNHYADYVNTLLAELDGISEAEHADIVVIGATNRKEAIDDALLRPGRLGTHIEIPKPDTEGILAILETVLEDIPTAADVTPKWIRKRLPGSPSGAQVSAVCEMATHCAVNEAAQSGEVTVGDNLPSCDDVLILRRHFKTALDRLSTDFDEDRNSDLGTIEQYGFA